MLDFINIKKFCNSRGVIEKMTAVVTDWKKTSLQMSYSYIYI